MSSEKLKESARRYYYRVKDDPVKLKNRKEKRDVWYAENKGSILVKQRLKKRERKLEAIDYLGGECNSCHIKFHPSVYEFHHRKPEEKDRDPSKVLNLSRKRMYQELDKCDLLCANCHRIVHHNWEISDGI